MMDLARAVDIVVRDQRESFGGSLSDAEALFHARDTLCVGELVEYEGDWADNTTAYRLVLTASPEEIDRAVDERETQREQLRGPIVERIKREILEDIASGVLPDTVSSFSALHDFVDANEYGGMCAENYPLFGTNPTAIGAVQTAVDEWLRAGRPKCGQTVKVAKHIFLATAKCLDAACEWSCYDVTSALCEDHVERTGHEVWMTMEYTSRFWKDPR